MTLPSPLPYIGYSDQNWNFHEPEPGPLACISPRYGGSIQSVRETRICVPEAVREILVDSAAFADRHGGRIGFEAALNRQLDHARRYKYADRISLLASYDSLLRAKTLSPTRAQRQNGAYFAAETVEAARYLSAQRKRLRAKLGYAPGLVLSAQGIDPEQYMECAESVVACMEPGDVFGLGGFVKTGVFPTLLLPAFCAITSVLVPFLAAAGVCRIHTWGVFFPPAVGHVLALCDQHGIVFSSDSSGPALKPAMGDWGYGSWRKAQYSVAPILDSCRTLDDGGGHAPTCLQGTVCRGMERVRHVRAARAWFADFRSREPQHYRVLAVRDAAYHNQLSWLDDVS